MRNDKIEEKIEQLGYTIPQELNRLYEYIPNCYS
jgi:hypothetical protein